MILFYSSLSVIIYVIKIKPFSSVYLNSLEIINEFLLFLCSCAIIAFSDYGPHVEALTNDESQRTQDEASMRSTIGWSYIGVTGIVILLSMGGLTILMLHGLYTKLKDKLFSNPAV